MVAQTIPALPPPPTPYSSIPTTPSHSPQQGRSPEEQRRIHEQRVGGLSEPGTAYGNARMPTPGSPGDHPLNREVMNFGKYKGKPFWYAYTDDDYLDWCLSNVSDRSCRGLKKFVEYIHERNASKYPRSYMALDDGEERTPVETDLVAILDLGCNKTCHGSAWFEKYLKAIGGSEDDFPLQARDGQGFVGIGGKVEVNGCRQMSVGFELSGGGIAVGTLFSTELKGSDAPLLLSISDQRKLGLTLELGEGEDKVYSSHLQEYLQVVATNGLLGIRLLPSHVAMLSKMIADEEEDTSTNDGIPSLAQEQKTTSTAIEPSLVPQCPASEVLPAGLVGRYFLELENGHHKVMSKGQKKMLDHATKEMKKQDMSLWSALCPKEEITASQRMPDLFDGSLCRSCSFESCGGNGRISNLYSCRFGFGWIEPFGFTVPEEAGFGDRGKRSLCHHVRACVWTMGTVVPIQHDSKPGHHGEDHGTKGQLVPNITLDDTTHSTSSSTW